MWKQYADPIEWAIEYNKVPLRGVEIWNERDKTNLVLLAP